MDSLRSFNQEELRLAKRRAYSQRPEVIAKRRAYEQRPDVKQRAHENYLKRYAKEETRDKHHAYWAEYSARPETKEAIRRRRQKPDIAARHNEQARNSWKLAREGMGDITNERAKKQKLRTMKRKARERKIEWDITDEEAWEMLHKACDYCGERSSVWTDDKRQCATIDRVDSKGDYSIQNIAPSCLRCNRMKNDLTIEEFLDHIEKIRIHMQNKKELKK